MLDERAKEHHFRALARKASSLGIWFVFNATTVISNKYLYEVYQFRYPITLTAIHMSTSSVMAFLFLRVLKLHPFTPLEGDKTGIYYLSLIFVVNILLGNFSLQYIPVSFMQAIKSTVPAFTVFIQVFVMGHHFKKDIYISLIPIVGGVVFASTNEVNFDMTGFVCALLASFTTAAQTAVSSKLLTTRLDAVNLLYYLGPISFSLLLPFSIIFDLSDIANSWVFFGDTSSSFVLLMSGVVAFLLNWSSFIAIKNTSALTFNVAGNFKSVINIILSVIVFQNQIPVLNMLGCSIALGGVAWYNYICLQGQFSMDSSTKKIDNSITRP